MRAWWVTPLLAGCGRVFFDPTTGAGTGSVNGSASDAVADARTYCFGPPFTALEYVPSASTTIGGETYPDLSADGLTLYVSSDGFPGGPGGGDIFVLTRPDTSSQFSNVAVVPISSSAWDTGPSISVDGLTLYYAPFLNDGMMRDVWVANRATKTEPFTTGTRIPALSAPGEDRDPDISPDGLTLYFDSNRTGSIGATDIWMSIRNDLASPFGAPTRVAELSSTATDRDPNISADGLVMYFASDRAGGSGGQDIWVSRRPDVMSPWGTPTLVSAASTGASEGSPSVSDDGTLVWDGTAMGGYDTYLARPVCP